jgi:hypothetical protein
MNSVSLPISPNDSELFEHKLVSQANDVDFTHLSHQNTWNWIFKPSVQFVSYFVTLAPYGIVAYSCQDRNLPQYLKNTLHRSEIFQPFTIRSLQESTVSERGGEAALLG